MGIEESSGQANAQKEETKKLKREKNGHKRVFWASQCPKRRNKEAKKIEKWA